MRVLGLASTLLLVVACGRTPLLGSKAHDAGTPRRDTAANADAARGTADAAGDTARPDARPTQPDTSPSVTCSALASLANRGVLTPRHAKQVLFAKDRSSLVLRVAGTDPRAGDEVMVIHLPGGEISYLVAGAKDIKWIDGDSRVLVHETGGELVAFTLDGLTSRTLVRGSCEHLTSPDGHRVLSFESCGWPNATLVSIDTRTGSRTTLGRTVRNSYGFRPHVVFSPSGEWIAFLEPSPAPDGAVSTEGVIHVVDGRNASYALTSVPNAADPEFASDKVLLFSSNHRDSHTTIDVRAHGLGQGDTSRVIARGITSDHAYGYHVSPDGEWMLAALTPLSANQSPYALSAYSMEGREVALAGDLFPFLTTQAIWYSFAFSADSRHVVYVTAGPTWGTGVVGSSGGGASSLSLDHDFVIPPAGNLVALTETLARPYRVRLTDLDTTRDIASVEASAKPSQVTFTPDGRSLVFVEQTESSTSGRLRHLSGRTGAATELAKWTSNQLAHGYVPCCNEPGHSYPLDPTGCFTVVDSDLDGGTRLVLLPESGTN